MADYELDPNVLLDLPDDTPMTVYLEPSFARLRGSKRVPVATTLGDVRAALFGPRLSGACGEHGYGTCTCDRIGE